MKDHYQALGLARSASEKEIKLAYHELCKQYHPDHNNSPGAHARMQEINEAHRVLSSPMKRAEYDQLLRLQEQQGKPTADPASASSDTEGCHCEKCGRVDPTLRVTVFTWVVSVLVITYRRGWAKVLCARCRIKYALLFDLQNFFMGWWGIPFGLFWTLQALWHNSIGGQQPVENNALLLAGLGYELSRKGELKAAVKALEASLAFKKDARVEAFCQQVKARCHGTGDWAPVEPRTSLWQRVATGGLYPAAYCAPMLAVLFCLAFLWLGGENKPPARARSVPARLTNDTMETRRTKAESGDAQAQCELGMAFYLGTGGVVEDDVEAVKWFCKAADQRYAEAQNNLGLCYVYGNGVARDCIAAVNWFRKASEQNYAEAQCNLGVCYNNGDGVAKDKEEALKWYRKAAEQNCATAQNKLGGCYDLGDGVAKDEAEAVKWYRKAAEQNFAEAQLHLGLCYENGGGVRQDEAEAVRWFRKAAEQNHGYAQNKLGVCYYYGIGVAKDYVEAYKWNVLAAADGREGPKGLVTRLEKLMTPEQIAEGQELAHAFTPREVPAPWSESSAARIAHTRPESSGTGFFITGDGYLVTNEHVVGKGGQVRLVSEAGFLSAKIVKTDVANDLALLKVEGKFEPVPLVSSRAAKMGSTVATVGFPNIGLQGFAPKLAKGEIAALSGAQDDPRYFQISVPLQPGNSGGALVDERGNVVGVVSAKLDVAAAVVTSGVLPENVNYAVKSSLLLSFLESTPEVSARLKQPNARERSFEQVAREAQNAAALVLVY